MRKINLFIGVVLYFIVTGSQAHGLVFRTDKRSPEEIYSNGFPSLGENDNILRHVEGESCLSGTGDSAFVATTTSYNFAVEFSQNVPAGEAFWVYSIRPSNNFYSAYNSLMNAYNLSHNEIFRTTADSFREQNEYMAFEGISNRQVMGAWLYRSNGYGIPATRLSYTTNPYYLEEDTDVNPNPYPQYYLPTPSTSISLSSCERCVNSTSPFFKEKKEGIATRVIRCKFFFSIFINE